MATTNIFDLVTSKGSNAGSNQDDSQIVSVDKIKLDNVNIPQGVNINQVSEIIDNITDNSPNDMNNANSNDSNSNIIQVPNTLEINKDNNFNSLVINDVTTAIANKLQQLKIEDNVKSEIIQDTRNINDNVDVDAKINNQEIIGSLPEFFFTTKFTQIDKSDLSWIDFANLLSKPNDPILQSYRNSKLNREYYDRYFSTITIPRIADFLNQNLIHLSDLEPKITKDTTNALVKVNKTTGEYFGEFNRPLIITSENQYRITTVEAGQITSDFEGLNVYGGTYAYYTYHSDLLYLSPIIDLGLKEFLIAKYALPTHFIDGMPLGRIITKVKDGLKEKEEKKLKDLSELANNIIEEIDAQIMYYINTHYTKSNLPTSKLIEKTVLKDDNISINSDESDSETSDYYKVYNQTLSVRNLDLDLSKYSEVRFINDIPKKPDNYQFLFNFNVAQFSLNLVSNTSLLDLALQLLNAKPNTISFRGMQYIITMLDKILKEINDDTYTDQKSLFSTKFLEIKHIDDKQWLKRSCQNFKKRIEDYLYCFCDSSAYAFISHYSYKDLFVRYYSKYNDLDKYYNIDKVYDIGGDDYSIPVTLNGEEIKMNIDIVNNLKKLFLLSDDYLEIFNDLNLWFFRVRNEVFIDEVADANMYAYGIICLFA